MANFLDVVVVGAGPYGLSAAAHLAARGINYRIFGSPMHFWRRQVPKGMLLKSDAYASNLSDPSGSYRLSAYFAEQGLRYHDEGVPVPAATFAAYGMAFQRRFGIALEDRQVVSVDKQGDDFLVRLDDGELIATRMVVAAAGIGLFPRIPGLYAGQPRDVVSHSSEHHELDGFAGRSVTVVGGGASSICVSALMQEAGADVTVVARKVIFHPRLPLKGRSLIERIREPHSGIGSGWRPAAMATLPQLFRMLPEAKRLSIAERSGYPAGGWAMRERFERVPRITGYEPDGFKVEGGRAHLRLRPLGEGQSKELVSDHVVLATGFENSLARLGILSPDLLPRIDAVGNSPRLSPYFESSVPGLFFIGPIARNTFGPLLRFVYGSAFAATRTTAQITRSAARPYVQGYAVAGAQ